MLDRANAVSIEALPLKAQLRWTGHVIRMDVSRMPQQILYGELVRGSRKKGRPKKRYKDCIKETLKQCSLPPRDLETSAQDRPGWRASIRSACSMFEDNRRDKISDARARRKASVATPDEATFQCPHCPRLCTSRIGLYSPCPNTPNEFHRNDIFDYDGLPMMINILRAQKHEIPACLPCSHPIHDMLFVKKFSLTVH